MKKKNGFTLIELISVLVILAILALIVTPLVMSIIKKAKISADKRSVDAYGRSVELAIANYLLDTGKFPTNISELTIEYSGDRVECSTTQLNSDSSIYLEGCNVNGRSVDNYIYGKYEAPTYQEYSVGDEVTYNNIDYYVLENSDETKYIVTLLKREPLTYSEVQTYSLGTGARTYNDNGYGAIEYHSSSSLYTSSYVKITIDNWIEDNTNVDDLSVDSIGYKARIMLYEEFEQVGYEWGATSPSDIGWFPTSNSPNWIRNNTYDSWTMSPDNDSVNSVWCLGGVNSPYGPNGKLFGYQVNAVRGVIRPVITIKKSALN